MKKVLLFALIIIKVCGFSVYSQQLDLEFVKGFGNSGWDYVTDYISIPNGGYYLVGSIKGTVEGDSTHPKLIGNSNAWMAKTDSTGSLIWQKVFGGAGFDNITSIGLKNNHIFISGLFQDSALFDQEMLVTSYKSGYIACLEASGNVIWAKKIGGAAIIDNIIFSSNANGDMAVGGVFQDSINIAGSPLSANGNKGYFAAKINDFGIESNPISFAATGACLLNDFVYSDSLLYMCGSFNDSIFIYDTIISSFGETDGFIACFNLEDGYKWLKTISGSGNQEFVSIVINNSKQICLLGQYDSYALLNDIILDPAGGSDIFLAVLDSSLNVAWYKKLGGERNEYAYSMASNSLNDIYISGSFSDMISFSDSVFRSINFYASSSFGNAFLTRYSQDGMLISSQSLPGTSENYAKSILVDNTGSISLVGDFYSDLKIQTNISDSTFIELESNGEKDIFFIKYNDPCYTYEFEAGNDTLVCPGQEIFLACPIPNVIYHWLPGGVENEDLLVNAPGVFVLFVENLAGCRGKDSLMILSIDLPFLSVGNDTIIPADEPVVINSCSAQNVINLNWSSSGTGYFDNETQLNCEYYRTLSDLCATTIILTIEANNQCGSVSDSIQVSIPLEAGGITAFPNPTNNLTTLVCIEGVIIEGIIITNQYGYTLHSDESISSTNFQFDLNTYPPGTYYYYISTNNGLVTKVIEKI